MKWSLFLPFLLVSLLILSLPPAASASHRLAIGPNGVDGADLTGDASNTRGDVHSVWLGTHGVAVWTAWRSYDHFGIDGVRFAADGQLIGAPVHLVEGLEPGLYGISDTLGLSATGNEMLLVWQNFTNGVQARRMASDLSWLEPAPVVLKARGTADLSIFFRISTAATPQRHGIVIAPLGVYSLTKVPAEITFARLGPSSTTVQEVFPVDIPDTDVLLDVAVASRVDGFLIAWRSKDVAGMQRVQVRTTGLAGVTTGPVHSLMTPVLTDWEYPWPRLLAAAPLGDGYAVAWAHSQIPAGGSENPQFPRQWRRLDAGGAPVADAQELFSLDATGPAFLNLQSVNGGVLALSSKSIPSVVNPIYRVIRRFLSADGTAGPEGPFDEVQAMRPELIDILSTGTGLLAVGEVESPQYYSPARAAVAAPLTASYTWGQPSRLLSQGVPEQQACAVASRGTDYLVVWQDGRDSHALGAEIRGRFFALDGTPSGASFHISNKPTDDISPAVAASGGKYLVAWCVNDVNGNDDVWAAFVTVPGNVSAPMPLATMEDRQENGVSVAGGANGGFFAAWRSRRLDILQPQYDDIYGTWIEPGGTVTVPNGFVVSASPGKERAVSVAGGTGTYGIVWREGGSHHSDVYGAVVPGNPVANPVSPDRITFTVASNAHAPEIAWNGSQYRVVWRNDGSAAQTPNYHIVSATLSETGVTGPVTTVADSAELVLEPAIVPWGAGWQIFWHQSVPRITVGVEYVYEWRVAFASMDAAGQVTNTDRFAPRFIDFNTLTAAPGPNGAVFIVYPTAPEFGRETLRTGNLETVLFYPERPAVDPQFAMESGAAATTLRWKADPWFPRDAGVLESGIDLLQWAPLLHYPPDIQALGTGDDAVVTFPSLPGTRRFFRLNSNVPGPP